MKTIIIIIAFIYAVVTASSAFEGERIWGNNILTAIENGKYNDAIAMLKNDLSENRGQSERTLTSLQLAIIFIICNQESKAMPLIDDALTIFESKPINCDATSVAGLRYLCALLYYMDDRENAIKVEKVTRELAKKHAFSTGEISVKLEDRAQIEINNKNYVMPVRLLKMAAALGVNDYDIYSSSYQTSKIEGMKLQVNIAPTLYRITTELYYDKQYIYALPFAELYLHIKSKYITGPNNVGVDDVLLITLIAGDMYAFVNDINKSIAMYKSAEPAINAMANSDKEGSAGRARRASLGLATAYESSRDYENALIEIDKAIKYEPSMNDFLKCCANGGDSRLSTERIGLLNRKALLCMLLNRTRDARSSISEAITLYNAYLKNDWAWVEGTRPQSCIAFAIWSLFYKKTGNTEKADELFKESQLKFSNYRFSVSSNDLKIVSLVAKGFENEKAYASAANVLRAPFLGKTHDLYGRVVDKPLAECSNEYLLQLSRAYYLSDDIGKARHFALYAYDVIKKQLPLVLSMDESTRLKWQTFNLGFGFTPTVLDTADMAEAIINRKGIVLDSIIEDRNVMRRVSKKNNDDTSIAKMAEMRQQLAVLTFNNRSPEDSMAYNLLDKIKLMEKEFAQNTALAGMPRHSVQSQISNIQANLNQSTILIEFIQYDDPKSVNSSTRCYGAILIGINGTVNFVKIPNADLLDSAARDVNLSIINNDEQSLLLCYKALRSMLWDPIASKLPTATKTIIIAPDGLLSFVPFAALQNSEGFFLSEKYEIVYVGSGRDLSNRTSSDHSNNVAIFANPVFDQSNMNSAASRLAMRSVEIAEFGKLKLQQLPGTEVEGKSLMQEAEQDGWAASAYFGDKATEQQIRAVKKPGILHLATHGFYLNAFTPSDNNTRGMKLVGLDQNIPVQNNGKGVDPMRASGIALTGAQATLKAWSEGKAPDPDNDGILTAEEVAGLDLDGTWLVTLSACETGVGEIKSGEGVFGLRRAFMMAGTQNLLTTLWPVNDTTTADFMKDFYHRALASDDAPRALADTQRDWLVKLRREKGLLAAVRDAGPFIMTTMGALPSNATFSAPQKKSFLK